MRVDGNSIVGALLDLDPELEELFTAYGVELSDDELEHSVRRLCEDYDLAEDDVLADIQDALSYEADGDAVRRALG